MIDFLSTSNIYFINDKCFFSITAHRRFAYSRCDINILFSSHFKRCWTNWVSWTEWKENLIFQTTSRRRVSAVLMRIRKLLFVRANLLLILTCPTRVVPLTSKPPPIPIAPPHRTFTLEENNNIMSRVSVCERLLRVPFCWKRLAEFCRGNKHKSTVSFCAIRVKQIT